MGRNYAWKQRVGMGGLYRQPPGEGGALAGRQCLEASRPWGIQKARPRGLVEGLDWFPEAPGFWWAAEARSHHPGPGWAELPGARKTF